MHGWVRFAGHFQPLIARDLNALDDHIIEAADGDFAAASRRLDENCVISRCATPAGLPAASHGSQSKRGALRLPPRCPPPKPTPARR